MLKIKSYKIVGMGGGETAVFGEFTDHTYFMAGESGALHTRESLEPYYTTEQFDDFWLSDEYTQFERANTLATWSESDEQHAYIMAYTNYYGDNAPYFVTYDNDKEITHCETRRDLVIAELLTNLYNKYIVKSRAIKQVQYQYNYTDRQTITFVYEFGRVVIHNVPTSMGYIRANELIDSIL